MTLIQSHSCDKCGGALLIDTDKQLYVCPFCGVTFDYDYFREENVLTIAGNALKRGEVGSAKEAYDFMLTKEPHNFEALRGILLCSAKATSLHDIKDIKRNTVNSDNPTLMRCLKDTEEKGKAYFEHLQKAGDLAKAYRKKKDQIQDWEQGRSSLNKTIQEIDRRRDLNKRKAVTMIQDMWEESSDKGKGGLLYLASLLLLGWGVGVYYLRLPFILITVLPVVLGITLYMIGKKKRDAAFLRQRAPLAEKLGKMDENINREKQRNEDTLREYNQEFREAVLCDPLKDEETQGK